MRAHIVGFHNANKICIKTWLFASTRQGMMKWRCFLSIKARLSYKMTMRALIGHVFVCIYKRLSRATSPVVDFQTNTVYPKKYAHGFVVLSFVVVMQSFIMNSHELFIHIHQGCFAGTWAIVRLPQCQWNNPDEYGKISQCITTTKHSKAKTVCIFLGIYCIYWKTSFSETRLCLQTNAQYAAWCCLPAYRILWPPTPRTLN